jgi:hypothetical protein
MAWNRMLAASGDILTSFDGTCRRLKAKNSPPSKSARIKSEIENWETTGRMVFQSKPSPGDKRLGLRREAKRHAAFAHAESQRG